MRHLISPSLGSWLFSPSIPFFHKVSFFSSLSTFPFSFCFIYYYYYFTLSSQIAFLPSYDGDFHRQQLWRRWRRADQSRQRQPLIRGLFQFVTDFAPLFVRFSLWRNYRYWWLHRERYRNLKRFRRHRFNCIKDKNIFYIYMYIVRPVAPSSSRRLVVVIYLGRVFLLVAKRK